MSVSGSTVPVESVGDRPGPVRHLAVDLGASGGRIAIGTLHRGLTVPVEGVQDRPGPTVRFEVEILHRWPHAGVRVQGNLYWDILGIWKEILHGLSLAPKDALSVGVNSWGVDYGLIDEHGNLLDGVHHYRSRRTKGFYDKSLERLGRDRIYEATGVQFMPINTAYQIEAHRFYLPAFTAAKRLLFVPDLIHCWLSGHVANERTIASTSQLYDPRLGDWSPDLLEAFDLPRELFSPVRDPGTILGDVLPEIGLPNTKVVLPASHDTASAVAAVPAQGDDWAYVSSGTWSLVGIETQRPVITRKAMEANLTNEAGYGGTTRLLKNVMGLWILQECRRAWGDPPFDDLYAEAEAVEGGPTFDPDDPTFLPPGLDMPERVRALCPVETRAQVVRAILDSLAAKTAEILDTLEGVSGRTIRTLHVVGGGSQIDLLNRLISQKAQRKVIAGPVEATLMGNLLVQAEAMGTIPKGSIRDVVRAGTVLKTYAP